MFLQKYIIRYDEIYIIRYDQIMRYDVVFLFEWDEIIAIPLRMIFLCVSIVYNLLDKKMGYLESN